jgi:hypothetical protein
MKMLRASLLGLLALIALPVLAAAPSAENATGKWLASVDAGGAPIELTFDLKAEGEKLTGTLTVMGNPSPISDGKVKGEDVSFKLAFDMGQGGPPLEISYVGKLKGDNLTMKSTFSMGDGAPPNETEFVAKRSK